MVLKAMELMLSGSPIIHWLLLEEILTLILAGSKVTEISATKFGMHSDSLKCKQ